jgi:ATP-binding cassette subfamily F protein uup
MAAPLLLLQNIHLSLGRSKLLDGAELSVAAGERLCLVGRNGSGKSTLLRIGAGLIEPDGGTRFAQPGATIRYLPQEPVLAGFETTRAYVEAGLAPGDDPNRAYYYLGKLGLTGNEATGTLSGGEARRAALARVLAPEPDILLLDEPTNHLDLPAIEWLEGELRAMRSALVLISHDRRFMENLGRATIWLERGMTRRLERGFGAYEVWRDEVLEQEERERHKLDRKIAMELDWVRYGVTARRKRNQRRMAELGALRRERREQRQSTGNVKLAAAEANQSGSCVIEAKGISKSYGAAPVVQDFSMRILRKDRVGIVGPNGAGKTTLLNLLTGRLLPDFGDVKLGANLAIASLDQSRALLDPKMTLSGVLTGGVGDVVHVGGQARHVMSYMKDFLFEPEQARTPVQVLSGGERARLLIAKALAMPSNLLVMDEPTNDLDLETLDLLEEMVADYPGTALIVSHDRDFLDRVVTSVLMAEGDGRFVEYAGGYSDMIAQRGEGVAAKEPAKVAGVRATPRERRSDSPKRKLSFAEKHALETLPKRIAVLTADISDLRSQLCDGALYTRDPKRFLELTEKLGTAEAELSLSETRWLELEMLRESVEGAG